jgi:hypothetical protein
VNLCRLVLGSLFLSVLLRQMSSHHTAADSPDDCVVSSIVARHTAHHRAFEATGGVGLACDASRKYSHYQHHYFHLHSDFLR